MLYPEHCTRWLAGYTYPRTVEYSSHSLPLYLTRRFGVLFLFSFPLSLGTACEATVQMWLLHKIIPIDLPTYPPQNSFFYSFFLLTFLLMAFDILTNVILSFYCEYLNARANSWLIVYRCWSLILAFSDSTTKNVFHSNLWKVSMKSILSLLIFKKFLRP